MACFYILLTPFNIGGISIVQIIGENAFEIVEGMFIPKNKRSENKNEFTRSKSSNRIYYGFIKDTSGIIDECLVRFISADRNCFPVNAAEINLHGGKAIVNRLCRHLENLGLKKLRESALLQIAFKNKRINLIQKEAYFALKKALTQKAAKLFYKFYNQETFKKFNNFLNEPHPRQEVITYINQLLKTYNTIRGLTHPRKVAIIGYANVGKSTLYNALLGYERVITSNVPGTTRDTIGTTISINGYPIQIYDTAGIFETADLITNLAINQTINFIQSVEIILLLFDANQENLNIIKQFKNIRDKTIFIYNKIDIDGNLPAWLPTDIDKNNILRISALKKTGLISITETILKKLDVPDNWYEFEEVIFTPRQKYVLENFLKTIIENDKSIPSLLGKEQMERLKNLFFFGI